MGTGFGISGAALQWNGPWENAAIDWYYGHEITDENGDYEISVIDGLYDIRAEAWGYVSSDWIPITFPPDTAGVDFALSSPRMECAPESFSIELNPGEQKTAILEISNTYTGVLHYACLEMGPFGYKQSSFNSVAHGKPFQFDMSMFPEPRQIATPGNDLEPDPEGWKLIYIDEDEEGYVSGIWEPITPLLQVQLPICSTGMSGRRLFIIKGPFPIQDNCPIPIHWKLAFN